MGDARFSGPKQVTVELNDGGTLVLESTWIFINTGARAAVPPVEGLADVPYLDNASIMELGTVPSHLMVLGGGFIGLEFAQMFRRFGAVVTILESHDRLLPREDEDIVEVLTQILEEDGIQVEAGARVEGVRNTRGGPMEVRFTQGDVGQHIQGSHLLVATGRRPNTDTLAPSEAGIQLDSKGFVVVNDRLETNVPGIWALGDVNGGPPFTHTAYDDYRIVKANLLDEGDASRAGRLVPYTLFTDPQLGRIGLTEVEARAQGYSVRVTKLPMSRVARAIETEETRGLMKAVVDADTDLILGAAILGVEGGEVATVVQMAMLGGLPYTVLRDGVFSHPTFSESLNNLFMAMDGLGSGSLQGHNQRP